MSQPLFSHSSQLRVRYAETDRMGYAYYGNYATYLEVARVEALRDAGIRYKDLEDQGVMMPVLEYWSKYLKPAFYDDQLTIITNITELKGSRLFFEYEVKKGDDLICVAKTTLVFCDASTLGPCPPPSSLKEIFSL